MAIKLNQPYDIGYKYSVAIYNERNKYTLDLIEYSTGNDEFKEYKISDYPDWRNALSVAKADALTLIQGGVTACRAIMTSSKSIESLRKEQTNDL